MLLPTPKVWKLLNWPNRISILRLMLVPPFVMLLLNLHDPACEAWARYAALGIFMVMAASDFLDGMLARRFNLRTRLGAILDPLADKILIVCSVLLLSIPAYAPQEFHIPKLVVVAVVSKDLWVVIGALVVYLVGGRLRIRPTLAGKLSTAIQLATIICILIVPDLEHLRPGLGISTAWGLVIATFAVSVFAIFSYTRLGLSFIVKTDQPVEHTNGEQKHGK